RDTLDMVGLCRSCDDERRQEQARLEQQRRDQEQQQDQRQTDVRQDPPRQEPQRQDQARQEGRPRGAPCPVPYQDACLDARAPEDLFRDGRELFAQGSYDNGFTMYERAAGRSYGPALTAWAQLIDPASFQPGRGFTRPNPERAIELYTRAI